MQALEDSTNYVNAFPMNSFSLPGAPMLHKTCLVQFVGRNSNRLSFIQFSPISRSHAAGFLSRVGVASLPSIAEGNEPEPKRVTQEEDDGTCVNVQRNRT